MTGDEVGFVAPRQELWACVAEDDAGELRGHVNLLDYAARSVMGLASEVTARDATSLAAVARLFVDPVSRRRSVGRSLLGAAREEAERLGRTAVLDVWVELHGAIRLYESCGWRRVGEVQIDFRSACTSRCSHEDRHIRSFVYVAPDG